MVRSYSRKGKSLNCYIWFLTCVFFMFCSAASGVSTINLAGGLSKLIFGSSPQKAGTSAVYIKPDNGLHGVWVTTVGNADFPSKPGLDAAAQKKEADAILDKVKSIGLNAVFLQVRPGADALYKSDIYPWSAVLTGTQGKDPGYDPLEYFIEGAHERGLKLEAWVNPYRIQTKADKNALCAASPAVIHADWTVTTSDGQLYFDPGIPSVRNTIEDGVLEIVKNYDVDGIVFDDYFYPGKNFADSATYKTYGGGLSIDDFRRSSVNQLISDLHTKIKQVKSDVDFGISPFGVWANSSQNILGCKTQGALSSYYDQYADTRLWVKNNWVDYICPQIYWSIGYEKADYLTILDWWANTVKGTNVDLYVSHAVMKQGTAEQGWNSPDQILLQIRNAAKYPSYKGSVFFDYADLCKNTGGVTDALTKYYNGKVCANSFGNTLSVSSPTDGATTGESKILVTGTSDYNFPLTINGTQVDRSPDGYFSASVNLNPGKNVITLKHKGVTKTLTVTCTIDVLRSVQPSNDITADGGSQITITAVAHTGAKVYAEVGGTHVDMSAADASGNDNSDGGASDSDYVTYSGTYTLPQTTPEVQDLGNIKVTAIWGDMSKSMQGSHVKVNALTIKTGDKCIAQIQPASSVNKQYVETFIYADNLYRPVACEQLPGSWDFVESNADGTPKKYFNGSMSYYRLSCGLMLYSGDIKITAGKAPAPNQIKGIKQGTSDSGRYTTFVFDFTSKITYNAGTNVAYKNIGYNTSGKRDYTVDSFNADSYSIYFFNTTKAPGFKIGNNPLFSSVTAAQVNATTVKYTFKLKKIGKFYGANVYYNKSGDLTIDFKNPWDGKMSDLRVSLDPGHGGIDYGAVAGNVNEKTINLNFASDVKKILVNKYGLKASNIFMTRTTDTLIASTKNSDLSLRTLRMVNFKSDLSVSIHQNDGGGEGFETYYFQPYSQDLAACVQSNLLSAYKKCGYTFSDRGMKFCGETAYYSCRQPQFPSVLVECGFIDNAKDRGFLTGQKGKSAITEAIAKSIVDYARSYYK